MARAVEQHKAKSAKRTSRRRTSQQNGRGSQNNPSKIGPPNCQAIDEVFFRRWRDLFGSERALQHLEDFLRSRPSWHVSTSGKVTPVDHPEFWQRTTLSVKINAEGVDCLAVRYEPYVHEPDYRTLFGVKHGRFFVRTVDVIEWEERLGSANNVISDYDPIAEFEREIEGRPRIPQRLSSTTAQRRRRRHPAKSQRPSASPRRSRGKPRSPTAPTSKKRTRKRPTVHDRLISLIKDLDLEPGMLPHEVLRAVKQPYKDKYHNEPSQSAVTRAYDQYEAAPTTSTKTVD